MRTVIASLSAGNIALLYYYFIHPQASLTFIQDSDSQDWVDDVLQVCRQGYNITHY